MSKSGKAKMLTDAEVGTALAHVAAASRYPERDRAMLRLSVQAALRAQEIAGLRWRHVLTADGSRLSDMIDLPAAITKRRRDRMVFMSPDLVEALAALRRAWPDRAGPDMPVMPERTPEKIIASPPHAGCSDSRGLGRINTWAPNNTSRITPNTCRI